MATPADRRAGRRLLLRRVAAYMIDMVLMFVVLAPVGVLVLWATGYHAETGPEIWRVLLLNFSLPVWMYFIGFESSHAGATPGKRLLRLHVIVADSGRSPAPMHVLARTAIKLLPWELVHVAMFALAPDSGKTLPFQWVLLGLAYALMLVYLIDAFVSGGQRAPHDRLAGTRIRLRG